MKNILYKLQLVNYSIYITISYIIKQLFFIFIDIKDKHAY